MDMSSLQKERLIVPTDFTRGNVEKLVPPSHFTSIPARGAQRSTGVKMPITAPPINWTKPNTGILPSADHSHNSCWLTLSQTQQEILELKKENQRLMAQLSENSSRGSTALAYSKRHTERSELWATEEWRLEAENYKAEAERMKGQVQTLKEASVTQRNELKDKDIALNRQALELEGMRGMLQNIKGELGLIRNELSQSNIEKEQINSQFNSLSGNSKQVIEQLTEDLERSREQVKDLSAKADQCRLQAEEMVTQRTQKLSEELRDLQKSQEIEQQEASRVNSELKGQLKSMTSEVLQLKDSLTQISAERDRLKEHLSQMRQAFETQSTTLQSLRNYIGQLAPESGERERLNETVERLNKEKAAFQTQAELLTIRLNSVNEILALQEEKMMQKNSANLIGKDSFQCVHVLQLWREKVFKLCVQLRTKDIELRGEKHKLQLQVKSVEQLLKQEQHQTSVLRHSLDDKAAALDLVHVENATIRQDLTQAQRENLHLKSQIEKKQKDLSALSEAVHRFSLVFNKKVSEMDVAQCKFNMCLQRVSFAKRRVETIQGLIMRKVALQKVQQSSKQAEQAADCIRSLQTELHLVSEERDKLTLELKRTPGLVEKALSDLKDEYEHRLMQKQQKLEQSVLDVKEAVTAQAQAQRSLEMIQDQLQQTEVKLEHLSSELHSQRENSQRALEERVSEIEERCAAKLKEMEDQVNSARAEHTRAVMMLRHFERQMAKKKELLHKEDTHTEPGVSKKGPLSHATAQQRTTLREQRKSSSQQPTVGPKVQLPADARLLSVLDELQSLSAAVLNSSEDSAEEEGQVHNNKRHIRPSDAENK